MTSDAIKNVGLSSPGAEREKLNKLLKIFDDKGFNLEDSKRRVRFNSPADDNEKAPKLTQRVKTFYVESWPEVQLNKDGSLVRPRSGRNLGGTPITVHTATLVREILHGSTVHSFCREWKKSSFTFQDPTSPYPWGLQTQRCGSRGLILAVQAYVIKQLLFDREYVSNILAQSALKPTEFERKRSLIGALCEILWKAGDGKRCSVCLLQDKRSFPQDYRLRDDNITEYVVLFEFKKFTDLSTFMRRNIEEFTSDKSPGCILFLYSLVLSASVFKLKEEMLITNETNYKLLNDREECTQALMNLIITGHACHYLHNGNLVYSQNGNLLANPLKGIQERSEIGFLFWDKGENDDDRTDVGSMLKTPKKPIWLTSVNGHPGLLFSTNLDLVSDWRVETRFFLHYYTGLPGIPACPLHIETRFGRNALGRTKLYRRQKEESIPQLERCIMTKWYGAAIDWPEGVLPFY
ncbi:inactive ubiquitin carboxyl-terminal hydrolase MINDY-4B-like isoform X2 [Saccostrea echinata]|uniref:inactive ubiquitin carboxyl-terminal hydrolase MINDY-4B-like isoform X2 n=1 Tax=Saccostrea echinata TaxID=191078 RepID=UPI002A832B2F|nr:inactive ubiquitin carboxyl-terminal hydrolase MINDY-4B-like isoform X2 [Saccostrea echinata]